MDAAEKYPCAECCWSSGKTCRTNSATLGSFDVPCVAAARSVLTNRKLHEASCIMLGSRAPWVPKSSNTAWHASRSVISKR